MTTRLAARAIMSRLFSNVEVEKGISTTYAPASKTMRRDALERWLSAMPKYRHSGLAYEQKAVQRREKLMQLKEEGRGPPKKGEGRKAKIRKK